jgi:hypothetical protein
MNPDVATARVNPFEHFISFGEEEGRSPHPLIQINFLPSELDRIRDAQQYTSNFGRFSRLCVRGKYLDPNPLFDTADYLSRVEFDTSKFLHPLLHYIEIGEEAGHAPGIGFSLQDYADRYLCGSRKGALQHFFEKGHALGHHCGSSNPSQANVFAQARYAINRGFDFEETPVQVSRRPELTALAYYLPQFHREKINDAAWGTGYTEWNALAKALPRFSGHRQPRAPRDLGYYDLLAPGTIHAQAELARGAGISVFGIYYYWMSGGQPLRKPLELLRRDRSIDMGYCLIWANESWSRTWDGLENELILKQDYPEGFCETLVDDWIQYFEDPRYFRVSGRPVIILYRALGIPETEQNLNRLREALRRRTGEDLLMIAALTSEARHFAHLPLDGLIEFPPHETFNYLRPVPENRLELFDRLFRGQVYSYDEAIKFSLTRPVLETMPLIRTAVPCWDNEPRRSGWSTLLKGSTPAKYEAWLSALVRRSEQERFLGERIVAINAWNEWAEGAYLEPDSHFGNGYLNATARALSCI